MPLVLLEGDLVANERTKARRCELERRTVADDKENRQREGRGATSARLPLMKKSPKPDPVAPRILLALDPDAWLAS